MRIARALVSGVDVWLNTPRRPLEASGTSGMKAAANGALNAERPRRLVRRGLARSRLGGRLGDRPRRGVPGRQRRRARGRAPLRPARARGRAALLRARGHGPAAARLDQADEERHREARARSTTRRGWCASTRSASTCRRSSSSQQADRRRPRGAPRRSRRGRSACATRGRASPSARFALESRDEVAVGEPVRVVGDRAARRARRPRTSRWSSTTGPPAGVTRSSRAASSG